MGKRKASYSKKKCIFRGNQYRKQQLVNESEENSENCSASKRKLSHSPMPRAEGDTDTTGNVIFDLKLMFAELEKCLRCICGSSVHFKLDNISGLGCKIVIICVDCSNIGSFSNCPMTGKTGSVYTINRRAVYALRCLGQGLAGLRTFCGIMNMRPPVQEPTYNIINSKINDATKTVKRLSMSNAAAEEITLSNSPDLSVSCDGTWLTRGHSSLHGVCTVIGAKSGKVVDTKVLSSYCKACEGWRGKENTCEYAEWFENHEPNCSINHKGTAGGMEVEGMKKIFSRSERKHGARYVNYIGDGDTKSFKAVSEVAPYGPNKTITKIECVGHIQKRMGTHLRKMKLEYKGKKLTDNKKLTGRGRLTDAVINTLTRYYGNAIREHSTSVDCMRTAIWAIWYHKASTDSNPTHYFCPKGANSWCPYQRAVSQGNVSEYKHKNTLPLAVMEAIKPVFKNLVTTDLLRRCVGAYTQNVNESLNAKIWKTCPKTGFCGKNIVKIATNDAVITFNDGVQGRLKVISELGMEPGRFCEVALNKEDLARISTAEKRQQQSTKEARKSRKKLRLEETENKSSLEGTTYAAGEF